VNQENESATTELYLQTFHLTKRFFTELSRVGGRAGTASEARQRKFVAQNSNAGKRRAGRIQIEILVV